MFIPLTAHATSDTVGILVLITVLSVPSTPCNCKEQFEVDILGFIPFHGPLSL